MQFKKVFKHALFVALGVSALGLVGSVHVNANTIHQRGNALAPYSTYYRFVNNHNYGYSKRDNQDYYYGSANSVNYSRGNERVNFNHPIYIDDGNPQSLAITPHKIAYVMYNNGGSNDQIAKYNLNQVQDGSVTAIKSRSIKAGHGQGLAYNPKAKQLWAVMNPRGSSNYTSVEEISQRTLKPIRTIRFRFGALSFGDVLTFDKYGNAYNCVRTFSGSAPVGSIKIYKGRITNHSVHFHLVRQGIGHGPGVIIQNMGYNPSNNRLYFISDSAIVSVPVNKLGRLRPRDVRGTKFTHYREFEDLAFYGRRGYLLLNSPERILVSNHNF